MFHRNTLMLVAGAAIFALNASAASAQDTTTTRTRRATSTRRIPIAKESHGEVAATTTAVARVDTVTLYKTDTLRLQGRVDTVTTTNTVTKVDTVVQTVNLTPRMIGGLYFGLAGGTALPYGSIRTVNNPGALGQLNIGWQGLNSVIGIRGDVAYTQYSENATYADLGAKPDLWNANLDLKLALPLGTHLFGSSTHFSPYLIGGGSYLHYRNLRMMVDRENGFSGGFGPQHALIAGNSADWQNNWGWNVGGGLGWHFGSKEVFIESRAIRFSNNDQFGHAWHVPVAFGVNFY
jgi:hypothetical protein